MVINARFNPSKLILSALEYIMLGLIILCTTSMWMRYGFGFSHINISRAAIVILGFLIALYKILFNHSATVPRQWLIWVFFLSICFGVGAFGLKTDFFSALELMIPSLCFLTLAFLLSQSELSEMCRRYVNLIALIACVSLFFFVFGSVLHLISPSETVTYDWDGTRAAATYYGLYYEPQVSDSLLSGMVKNCGIFGEGTMYGFMLCIAYMFERNSYKPRFWILIILIITIFSTLSTMPILAWLIFEGILYITNKNRHKQLRIIKVLTLPVFIAALFLLILSLVISKMTTSSYGIRYDHMINCFKVFFESFPFGYGYGNAELLKETFYYSQGLSVGIPYMMALGGVGGLLIIIIPAFLYLYYSWKLKKWNNIAFAISFECLFFWTNIVFNSTLQWFIITVVFLKGSYEMKKELAYNRGGLLEELLINLPPFHEPEVSPQLNYCALGVAGA